MNPESKTPSPNLDDITTRVTAAVKTHQTRLRVLTSLALLFGFLAVVLSVLIVAFYPLMYLPKQKELIRRAETAAAQAKTETVEETVQRLDKFVGVGILMTHVVSLGTTIVAAAVGLLALGTLVLVLVVVLNRRATLNQINASLAQISGQLKELQSNGR
jgi:predicted PurR-regulated permease PerM